MDSTVFKYKYHYQQQQQQQQHQQLLQNQQNINNNNHNNNNQNSIFILNTTTNNILPNNPKLFYSDLNDNNVVSSSSSSNSNNTASSSSSSVWSSASSTMCSPAAHAIQKLFNCSSNSFKLKQGNYSGIETKSFKTKSELLKKKTKFWKYLEGEANDKNNQRSRMQENTTKDASSKEVKKSLKYKTKYWLKSSCESNNQNNQDLAELLEYSCSLCDNCQCMDCQIAYFDCDNSDDSNSEYSFHLSAYEEDEDEDDHHDDEKTELNSTQDKLCNNLTHVCNSDCPPDAVEDPMLQSCQLCLLAESDATTNQ